MQVSQPEHKGQRMSNSKWKPFSDIPDNGSFLVWAPDRENGRKPYLRSNIAVATRHNGGGANVVNFICGHFQFDMPTPHLYCEMDDLIEQLPIAADQL